MMTISIISGMFPTFLVSPFAGVWADRFDRKKLIILADSAIAITTLAAAVAFFIFLAAFLFFCAPAAFLTPLQVTRNYGKEVWRLTAIEVAFSVRMMAGGIIMSAWGGFRNRVHTMILASLLMGAATIALGFVPWYVPYLAIMAFFGLCLPAYNTPLTVILQEKVEDAYLGRVFGIMTMISTVMMPLGMIVFGPLADMMNIEYLLIGTGTILAAVSLLMAGRKTPHGLAPPTRVNFPDRGGILERRPRPITSPSDAVRLLTDRLDGVGNGGFRELESPQNLRALQPYIEDHKAARTCRDYLITNRDRMRYPEFRRKGLCTSSGVVEAGCKLAVGTRLKRAGMHWTLDGANSIIALRCCKLSGNYEDFLTREYAA